MIPFIAFVAAWVATQIDCRTKKIKIMIDPIIYAGLPAYQKRRIYKNVDTVFEVVKIVTGYSADQLIGRDRRQGLVDARILFAWALRFRLNRTLMYIADQLKRDHTSIIYYFEVFDARLETEPTFRRNHEAVLAELRRRF